ncbi:MAG: metallophosphoesterase [Candidatus Azobacteroides sp.]|nr:metallophosphoesterase [Candidatus Azobacteroides sp.]
MLGRNILPLPVQKILYFPGTVWLGMMLYLFAYFLLTDFIHFVNRFFPFLPTIIKKNYRQIQVFSGYILVLCLAGYGYYQFKRPQIVEQKIEINKKAGDYKHLKIVGVSDLHLGVAIDKKQLKQYVRLINDQHPDLILIAGDLVDNNALPLEKERMQETINELQAPLGVYYCLGNHEYLSGIKASMNFLRKTDLHLLIDSLVTVNNSIQIIGRDDKQGNPNRKSLKELVKNTDPALPLLLIDHEAYHLNETEENGIDLQFSGHTHHGQMFPGNLITDLLFQISYGYEQKGNTHYYVSSGLGLWGPPFRIGTQSELVIFNIEFK